MIKSECFDDKKVHVEVCGSRQSLIIESVSILDSLANAGIDVEALFYTYQLSKDFLNHLTKQGT